MIEDVCYSVVIPAFNEARFLPATLATLEAAMAGVESVGEVIVVDNNSTDGTAELALEGGARVVFEPINQISRARNKGASSACGKYLIFIDADTLVPESLLNHALVALNGGMVCGGGATVAINHPNLLLNGAVATWNAIGKASKIAAGCFLYCRADAFMEVGGFSEAVYASEEIWLSLALKKWGRQHQQTFLILEDKAHTSSRKIDWMSSLDIAKQGFVLLLFPLAVRSKRLCRSWYYRPDNDES